MDELIFLTAQEVIDIQRETLPQGAVVDIDKLEGALGRVINHHHYNLCDDVFELAAVYLISIAKSHAFADANKRTAFISCASFLRINGQTLRESFFLVKLTVMVAEDKVDVNQVAFLLRLLGDYYYKFIFGSVDDLPEDETERFLYNLTVFTITADNIETAGFIAVANRLMNDTELDEMAHQIVDGYRNPV
ncbi:type II toxin-antitoxin system death-on-curing family toxin [Serratia quinivorans]|uniref:type II toxin-antitoxin system death-on-curing family toxin n=1 Tax=Serratia quinivorans TaxID=137545 RepID=UPI002178A78B|nr:type II toxin-antitoxin system death-on-curing family toxin [Serratia quinivorans]CAI0883494.1 death-on-curing family protein [Serratia quinivorans]CAI1563784.1 death-on-curing family protein [Serratia quinivorans]